MKLLAHTSLRSGLILLAGCGFAAGAFAQTASINSIRVSKDLAYVQRSASAVLMPPQPSPCNFGCFYRFAAYVNGGNMQLLAPPTVSGPVNTGAIGATWNGGVMGLAGNEWRLGNGNWDYDATQAGIDSRFGSGTYTISVGGTNVALNLGGDVYPNAPSMTFSGGQWEGNVYYVDPARPFTVTSNAFSAYGSHRDSQITMYVGGGGINFVNRQQFHSSEPGSNQSSITVPANTLVEGREYYASTAFYALVDINTTALPGVSSAAEYRAITNARVIARSDPVTPPVFPMTVTSNITPTTANATAQIQYRPQDVGTNASTYVFAVAPATIVRNAAAFKDAYTGWKAVGAPKDDPVQCVLAQLSSTGELRAVSAANLVALTTGVLTAQGASVNVLNNVSTPNVAGATMFIGYGANATAMMNNGINRSVVGVPGTVECRPQAPQTGWWWNPDEGGRGYSIEVQGNKLFMAAYYYDASGRATWLVASGPTSLEGSLFTAPTFTCSGGVTLAGAYRANNCVEGGAMTLAFANASTGTMVWPGGTVPIRRFDIVPGGLGTTPQANIPESGWWWSAAENGRGYFIEWQNGSANIAGYMYDDAGNPIWYITVATTPNAQAFNSTWWQYANGQTQGGVYRAPTQVSANVGPTTIQFTSATTATMTLPGGRQIALTRFRF